MAMVHWWLMLVVFLVPGELLVLKNGKQIPCERYERGEKQVLVYREGEKFAVPLNAVDWQGIEQLKQRQEAKRAQAAEERARAEAEAKRVQDEREKRKANAYDFAKERAFRGGGSVSLTDEDLEGEWVLIQHPLITGLEILQMGPALERLATRVQALNRVYVVEGALRPGGLDAMIRHKYELQQMQESLRQMEKWYEVRGIRPHETNIQRSNRCLPSAMRTLEVMETHLDLMIEIYSSGDLDRKEEVVNQWRKVNDYGQIYKKCWQD